MAKILITGMSGTGKSTALRALASRGHRAVDTDGDRWSRLAAVEPLLRATATAEIDASAPLDQVVRRLEDLARA